MTKRCDGWYGLSSLIILSVACVPTVSSDFARQVVNERLRGACPDHTDTDIEATIISIEADLLRGVTKQQEIEIVTDDCIARGGDADATDACITCAVIVVDEIYGP